MARLIITTVGTSIFENSLLKFGGNTFSELYNELKKASTAYAFWQDREKDVTFYIRSPLEKKKYYRHEDLSAEIASIIAIQKELNEEVTVHLLATDTVLSVLAAELIKSWFEHEENLKNYPNVKGVFFEKPNPGFTKQKDSQYVVKDLRINEQEEYDRGVLNLFDVLNQISKDNPILNITGGYKSIIPIVTIWAQLEQLEMQYIFNEYEIGKIPKPISLPGLPVNFDWEVAQSVTQYLSDKILKAKNARNPYFNENLDAEALKLLMQWKLISSDGSQTTSLAKLLKVFVEKRSMTSRDSVLGLMMEYKYYEYFNEFSPDYEKPTKGINYGYYFWNGQVWTGDELTERLDFRKEELSYNIRGWNEGKAEENKIFTIGDFDLIFRKKNSGEKIIGEVKASRAFNHDYKYKVWQRGLAFQKKHEGKLPNAYFMLLYNVKFQHEPPKDYNRDKVLLEKLKTISVFLNEKLKITFRAFICDINLSSNSFKVHYDDLLRYPIKPDEIIWDDQE